MGHTPVSIHDTIAPCKWTHQKVLSKYLFVRSHHVYCATFFALSADLIVASSKRVFAAQEAHGIIAPCY